MDKIGIRTIVVNFDDEQLPYLSLVQGDAKTRGFDIIICDSDGKEIPPNDDYIIELVATGSNAPDTPYANRHNIKDGKYRVMIPTEALSESGFVFLQLVFYQKSTGAVIHTIEQKCPVYRSRGQEVVESNNLYVDITALRLGLERINELDIRYENMLSEEKTRQDAEKKRNEHEAYRVRDEKVRQSNENTRMAQEVSRVSVEETRVSQEAHRISAENKRASAEDNRWFAETDRRLNEDKRVSAESKREEREGLRQSQESKRVTAEKAREEKEVIRMIDEDARNSRESNRISSEKERVIAEKERVSAEKERKATWETWETNMGGGSPDATSSAAGVVKIKHTETERAPYTAVSLGVFDDKLNDGKVVIGSEAFAQTYSVAIGNRSSAHLSGVAAGNRSSAEKGGVAIGYNSFAKANSVAIGYNAKVTEENQGVLGVGSTFTGTNNWLVPGIFSVGGTKNFEIPHPNPEKTETHLLRHGAVETNSQGDNLYRYKIEAKEDGETIIIDLPDYFVHLNKNIQIWATGINHFGNAFGNYKPDDETIEITCEKTGEYNILVIGTRNDNHKSVQSWSDKGVEKLKGTSWTFAEDLRRAEAEAREQEEGFDDFEDEEMD